VFGRKKKQQSQARNAQPRKKGDNQRVISYYTASRQQLDNFDRRSAAKSEANSLSSRRMQNLRRAWFTLLTTLVLVGVVGYSLTLSKTPSVVVNGDLYRSQLEYEKLAAESFNGDPRNLLKPTLQEATLASDLRAVFPEARKITVKSSLLGHNPEVSIETDKPLAQLEQPNGDKIVLGERGRLLLPTSDALDTFSSLPVMRNSTSVEIKPGQQFIRPDEANAFRRLLGQYSVDKSIPTSELVTVPQEILVREPNRGGYYVRYLLNDSIVLQYGASRATQKELAKRGEVPAEYIDVRLAEKAFYK
jgi:hypothetical protein